MTRFIKTRSIALGLVAATTIAAATPTLADSWQRHAAAAGIGFVAGTAVGAAMAQPYWNAYAYAPAYGHMPYGAPGGNVVVGSDFAGVPIYASELNPNCTLGDRQFGRC